MELLRADKLRELHLTNILKWSKRGWLRFTEALGQARSLRLLRMYRSSIGATSADGASLWRALQKVELASLSVGQEFLDEHDFDSIDLALPTLRHLRVWQCNVGAGGPGLARGIAQMPELHTLELTTLGLRDAGAAAVWEAVAGRPSIKVLDVSHNSQLDANRFAHFAATLEVLRMRGVPITSELTVQAVFERARHMTELRVTVDVLTPALVEELARSVSHRDCRLAELFVELSWAKKKAWRDDYFTLIADALERNTSLLRCTVEPENYATINDTSHPDALRIERICQLRADENREILRRKRASLASQGRVPLVTAAAVVVSAIVIATAVWAVFYRKKET